MPDTSKARGNNRKLVIGMTNDERYELLKEREITVVSYDKEKYTNIDESDLVILKRTTGKNIARKTLRKIGEQFGVFKQGYTTQDVDFEFAFSRNNLRESIDKQFGQFQNYAKMMTVFTDVISNAVCIDSQRDRYESPDSELEAMYVFVSAFMNDDGIVPVLLEVKVYEYEITASLYVAVSMREIEGSRILAYIPDAESTKPYTSPTSVKLSLTDFLPKVNIEDKNLIKYIPDGFLSDEQMNAKQVALAETAEYIAKKKAQRADKSNKSK